MTIFSNKTVATKATFSADRKAVKATIAAQAKAAKKAEDARKAFVARYQAATAGRKLAVGEVVKL